MKETNLTLVVMAAGLGSRFGGLKQMTSVSKTGEFIIDYSVYDARKAGFTKVVFIIRKELQTEFEETIASRIRPFIDVEYVFQEMEDLPISLESFSKRTKPWGTAHAIYAARKAVDGPFAVINADDFYGRKAFFTISDFLKKESLGEKANFGIAGYQVEKTLSPYGEVKRGVCIIEHGHLEGLVESKIERTEEGLLATPLDGKAPFLVQENTLVSMNLFAFTKALFPLLEKGFVEFFETDPASFTTMEYQIPTVLTKAIWENSAIVTVLPTDEEWFGLTYPLDIKRVKEKIEQLIAKQEYPQPLWKK